MTSDEYLVRYDDNGKVRRTWWDTLAASRKRFNELRKDSSCKWAELLFEPIAIPDKSEVIDSFDKQVIDVLGQSIVINM